MDFGMAQCFIFALGELMLKKEGEGTNTGERVNKTERLKHTLIATCLSMSVRGIVSMAFCALL